MKRMSFLFTFSEESTSKCEIHRDAVHVSIKTAATAVDDEIAKPTKYSGTLFLPSLAGLPFNSNGC